MIGKRRPPNSTCAAVSEKPWEAAVIGRRNDRRSNIANVVFPLRHGVGDHACGFHRGLAELGIAGDLALHALAFVVQKVAQGLEFGNQILDFRKRRPGDALDQRVDVVDGSLGVRLKRRLGVASHAWHWTA